ncbi:P2X purinoceptor 7-like [Ostrea edulis]|uniref:P2X purinoceptor 7-like n=1 Tax=Ostrea edulis TaxID=37623 RepID=UPI0024AF756C|nr:P2X purinoceptor 7-like [Ostrea edulis]
MAKSDNFPNEIEGFDDDASLDLSCGEEIPDTSEMYRYVAYRQLARWAWGYLGQKVKVVLPSCAVNCIRNTFPSDSGSYTGFKPQ